MAKNQMMQILSSFGGDAEDEKPLNVYLWGFQPHFASSVKHDAARLFKYLDEMIVPDVFVVAINTDDKSTDPKAIVEPHDHEFTAEDFKNVLPLVHQLEKTSPGPFTHIKATISKARHG